MKYLACNTSFCKDSLIKGDSREYCRKFRAFLRAIDKREFEEIDIKSIGNFLNILFKHLAYEDIENFPYSIYFNYKKISIQY